MLNGRLYRAAFVPFVVVLAVVAFSLVSRPKPLSSTLAPDAFEGAPAYQELQRLTSEFPDRRAGSTGDERLERRIVQTIQGLGGSAGGGFTVHVKHLQAQTLDGERALGTVIAERPGSTGAGPIVILAHRDAAQPGSAGELSGTAMLLELARVFATRETQRSIVLVSTSGGSGGDAGAAQFAARASGLVHGPIDAVIVLGDVASARVDAPLVMPYSDGYGSAPDALQRTVSAAILHEAGIQPGAPSALGQLAHLAFPFAPGEQGPLVATGLPAVLVQLSGERGPGAKTPVSVQRMEGVGKATLSAVDALDAAPALSAGAQRGIGLSRQIIPAWALRLLIGSLLIPPLVVLLDGLARARRRHEQSGRWIAWALSCALPFFASALFALLLGALGAIPALAAAPALPQAVPFDAGAATAVLACSLVLGLCWLAWPLLVRRAGLLALPTRGGAAPLPSSAADAAGGKGVKRRFGVRVSAGLGTPVGSPEGAPAPAARGVDTAGVATMLLALALAVVVWVRNPYAALLIIPALHLLLPVASPEWRPRPLAGLGLLALAFLPLALLIAFFAHDLGFGLGGIAYGAVLMVAGGHVGIVAAAAWSIAFGCAAAMALVAVAPPADVHWLGPQESTEITIRGPLSYAGPGSLGGTGSALRR